MGEPHRVNLDDSDILVREYTLGSETSQYQEEKKRKSVGQYFVSSGERKRKSPNRTDISNDIRTGL